MTQNDIDSGGSTAVPDDDDMGDYAIIRIPRRTMSAPAVLTTISYAPPETTLLTLPLELQQKILRNLLSGAYTLTSPVKYTLHPAILRVNRHLSSVGKEILYNENDWILIENASPFLRNQLRFLHVPIASTHHLMRFNEHRLSLRFGGDLFDSTANSLLDGTGCLDHPHTHPASRACDLFPRGYWTIDSAQPGNLLLHGGDMRVIVRALSLLSHCFLNGNGVHVIETRRGKRPFHGDMIFPGRQTPPTTMIRAQRNTYDKQDLRESFKAEQWRKKINTLVGALKGVPGVRQTSISGDVDTDFAWEVKSFINSKVVFREAMGWHLIDSLCDYKKDLDAMVYNSSDRDCLCLATTGYGFLLDICHGSYLYSPDRISDTNIGKLSWEVAFLALASDTSMTLSRINFHKGKPPGSWGIINSGDVCPWFKLLEDRGTLQYLDHSFWIKTKHHSAVLHGAAGFCARAKDMLVSIVQEATAKGVNEHELTNVRYDLAILQWHLDDVPHSQLQSGPQGRRVRPDDPRCKQPYITRKRFSQGADSFRDHLINTDVTVPRDEGLEGWLDTKETLTEYDLAKLEIIASDVPAVLLQ